MRCQTTSYNFSLLSLVLCNSPCCFHLLHVLLEFTSLLQGMREMDD